LLVLIALPALIVVFAVAKMCSGIVCSCLMGCC